MTLLIVGLIVFLGVHMIPVFTGLRSMLVASLGEQGYRGAFAVASLLGLVLIVLGFGRAPYVPVYDPLPGARTAALAVMPFVFVLLAAANMPGHIRRVLRHPMLIAVLAWSIVHLMANGDLRSIILFGAFGAYAVIDSVSEVARGKTLIGDKPASWTRDLMAVVGGFVLYGVVAHFHGSLFGVALY